MQTPHGKRYFSGALAAAVGIAAFGGSLISAETSLAAVPAAGLSCVATDGKVNGRGSTYQTSAQATFWAGFRDDFCGAVTSDANAGTTMGVYNYTASSGNTGSGNGIKGASCRTDAYSGTDLPYSEAQLAQLNGAPGAVPSCGITFTPPFPPNTAPFPNPADQSAPIMSFPIAGSSVAIAVNLQAADCGGTKPATPAFTPAQMTYIEGGSAITWNDPKLVAGNPTLANCTGAITRVVRQDNSGTTGIYKSYLIRIDDARTGATCAGGATWTSFNGSPNTSWPSGSGCSPLAVPATSGGSALISLLATTHGGIGYADLADEVNGSPPAPNGFEAVSVQNAAATSYQSPGSGKAANCDYSVLSLPGSSGSDAVGLNGSDNWGNDNAIVNGGTGGTDHVNATDLGVKYPICGITFDLVYSNLGLGGGASPNAISTMTSNQRRTLYSFVTYVLSSTAQGKLGNIYYAPLPTLWLPALVSGFQSNY